MSSPRDFILTNDQLAIMLDGADHVSPEYRQRFLDAIADRLVGHNLDNDTVQSAVRVVLTHFGAGAA